MTRLTEIPYGARRDLAFYDDASGGHEHRWPATRAVCLRRGWLKWADRPVLTDAGRAVLAATPEGGNA